MVALNSQRRKEPLGKLYDAQRGICASCGRRMVPFGDCGLDHLLPSIDHLIARKSGGGDHIGNMVAMHRACNSAKGDRSPTGCERIFHHLVLARLDMHPLDMAWRNDRAPNTAMANALKALIA